MNCHASSERYPNEESMAAWKQMRQARWKRVAVVASLWVVLATSLVSIIQNFIAFGVCLMVSFATLAFVSRIQKKHYYAIPHSRDPQGQHRCIFCGHRGIFLKSQDRANRTHNHCSRCEELLFTE